MKRLMAGVAALAARGGCHGEMSCLIRGAGQPVRIAFTGDAGASAALAAEMKGEIFEGLAVMVGGEMPAGTTVAAGPA